ncbi:transcription termination factor NusA [Deltaproteobacteria bacterium TL4]
MKDNILEVINDVSKEKGLDRDLLVQLIEDAIVQAASKKLPYNAIECQLNQKTGEMELFHYKRVVEFPEDPDNEIALEVALEMDESAAIDDEVEYEIEEREFNRIAQSSRQIILKKVKEAEREMVFNTFKERKGEILTGEVVRTESNGRVSINFLNKTEAYLFKREQIPGEVFTYGDHIRVYLMDVSNDPQKPSQLAISRTHPGLLIKLFEMEVPEIYDGIVTIVSAAREPGKRAKISVYTEDPDVDPVGACVGIRGSRVQSIVSELQGEKIDIVRWNEVLEAYATNALAPAEVMSMEIDKVRKGIDVWVEPDQLSLAIGRQGQNVRLASKLIGYKINVSAVELHQGLSIDEQLALEMDKKSREEKAREQEKQDGRSSSGAALSEGASVRKESEKSQNNSEEGAKGQNGVGNSSDADIAVEKEEPRDVEESELKSDDMATTNVETSSTEISEPAEVKDEVENDAV